MADKNITPKQRKFVTNYVVKKQGLGEAYINAGYKVKSKSVASASATRLLKNVNVKAYISKLQQEAYTNDVADLNELMIILSNIARRVETEDDVKVVDGRVEVIEKRQSTKEVIKACEMLLKYNAESEDDKLNGILEQIEDVNSKLSNPIKAPTMAELIGDD